MNAMHRPLHIPHNRLLSVLPQRSLVDALDYTHSDMPFALTGQRLLLRVLHGDYGVPVIAPRHVDKTFDDKTNKSQLPHRGDKTPHLPGDPREDKAGFAKLIAGGHSALHRPVLTAEDNVGRYWRDKLQQRWRYKSDDTGAVLLAHMPLDYRHLPGHCVAPNHLRRNPLTADTDALRQALLAGRTALRKVSAPTVYAPEDFFSDTHITATDAQGPGIQPVTRPRAEFTGTVHARARDNPRDPRHVFRQMHAAATAKERREDIDKLSKQARTPMSATLMTRALANNPHDIRLKPVDFEKAIAAGHKALHHVDMDKEVWRKKHGGWRLRHMAAWMAMQRNMADVRLNENFRDQLQRTVKQLHKTSKDAVEDAGAAGLAVAKRQWRARMFGQGKPVSIKDKEQREKTAKVLEARDKERKEKAKDKPEIDHASFVPAVSELTAAHRRLVHVGRPRDTPLMVHMGLPGSTATLGKGLPGITLAGQVAQRGGRGRSEWHAPEQTVQTQAEVGAGRGKAEEGKTQVEDTVGRRDAGMVAPAGAAAAAKKDVSVKSETATPAKQSTATK